MNANDKSDLIPLFLMGVVFVAWGIRNKWAYDLRGKEWWLSTVGIGGVMAGALFIAASIHLFLQ